MSNTPSQSPASGAATPAAVESSEKVAAEICKLRAETLKLDEEARHQRLMNRYWWVRWVTAGVAAGLSLTAITFGFARDQFSALREMNSSLSQKNTHMTAQIDEAKARQKDADEQIQASEERSRKLAAEIELSKAELARRASEFELVQQQRESARDKFTSDIAAAGANGSELTQKLAESTNELQAAREKVGELERRVTESTDQLRKAEKLVAESAPCTVAVGALTGTRPSDKQTGAELVRLLLKQFDPYNDFSLDPDRVQRRAKDLGISADEKPIAAIGSAAAKPIVFTATGILYSKLGRVTKLSYTDLLSRTITMDRKLEALDIGDGEVWDLSSSGFEKGHARMLMVQLQAIVANCRKEF